ncbi:Flp family type IVb pilin [Actinoplanes sp. GCM10030250]|uniref:Flp family type IVb pilin n=1 Tax=Actinoplanes sp. GCM10030250 TaxID=3273376 RepID=UPI00361AF7CC
MGQFKLFLDHLRAARGTDQRATAVEYSLLAVLFAGGLIAVVVTLREGITALFTGAA